MPCEKEERIKTIIRANNGMRVYKQRISMQRRLTFPSFADPRSLALINRRTRSYYE